MLKVKTIFLLLFISFFSIAHAQSKIELGIGLTPMISSMTGSIFSSGKPIYTLGFGTKMNWTYDRLQVSTGLLHIEQGAQIEFQLSSTLQPDGTGELGQGKISRQQILLPVLMRYIVLKREKILFTTGAGLYLGLSYRSKSVFSSNTNLPDSKTKVNEFYTGVNFGAGFQYQISPMLSFEFRPNVLYQLREISPRNSFFGGSMLSYGIDFGLNYTVNFNSDTPK